MKRKSYTTLAIAVALCLVCTGVYAAAFLACVAPTNLDGWSDESAGDASVEFVFGPSDPPLGEGSLEFHVGKKPEKTGAGAELLLGTTWDALPLMDFRMSYWTYVESKKHCQDEDKKDKGDTLDPKKNKRAAVYVAIVVDSDEDGLTDDTLLYEPAFNGQFLCETWQQWHPQIGLWYSANGGEFGAPGRPLAAITFVYPNAKVVQDNGSGIGLVAGFGSKKWKDFVGNADNLTISGPDPEPICSCVCNKPEGEICNICNDCEVQCFGLAGLSGTYDFEPVCPQ
jgi:hypothetical protein